MALGAAVRITLLAACAAGLCVGAAPAAAREASRDLRRLERSYWLHASLAADTRRGYWGAAFPEATAPTDLEVRRAARRMAGHYAASRLYLIYHREIPWADAQRVFRAWRKHLPGRVEIVPDLVLRMYDRETTPVFTASEAASMAAWFRQALKVKRMAVYDVYPDRDQGPALDALARAFPGALVRTGLQPGEALKPPFTAAVEDTWSGLCHGRTNEDWLSPGFGAGTLRGWVKERSEGRVPVAWDLVVVAWDYRPTQRGEYPGYDDGDKNMPLPAGRNRVAAREILAAAAPGTLAGFSSDLFIVHVNSATQPHDGPERSLYAWLKEGRVYGGYFAGPLEEVAAIYRDLRDRGSL